MLFRGFTLALLGLSSLVQAVPLSRRQGTFTLGSPLPSDAATAIAELEVALEQLEDLPHRTWAQLEEEGAIKALLYYTYGITSISAPDGTTTTITISSRKRQNTFTFGSALPNTEADAIDELQVDLEQLQDLSSKTWADWELIGAIKALLYYTYHITAEYAPPGTTTTLNPGKRQASFTLGGSLPSDSTEAIAELEVDLEQLQNIPDKTWADWELIGAIQSLLYYTYGITSISAPDGTTTTLTISSKRQDSFTLGGSLPSDPTEAIAELEVDLEELQDLPNKTWEDYQLIGAIKSLLYYTYHITSITAPDGTTTTLTISSKRQESFTIGNAASGLVGSSSGASTTLTPAKRQTFTIGNAASGLVGSGSGASTTLTPAKRQTFTIGNAASGLVGSSGEVTTTFSSGKAKRQTFTIGNAASGLVGSSGEVTTTFSSGKAKRQSLIGAIPSKETQAIAYLEVKLEELQNEPPTPEIEEAIWEIKVLLYFTYHITSISAPDGTTTTITISSRKRQDDVISIIGSVPSGEAEAIAYLEVKLEQLQDIAKPTRAEKEAIQAIKTLLYYTYHITSISAPSGTTTTLTPGRKL